MSDAVELDYESNPDDILRIAKEIHASEEEDKPYVFGQRYQAFKERYPKLFEMCCKPDCNINHLLFMVNMMKNVRSHSKSYKSASEAVGQHFVDVYVKPMLPDNAK